MRNTKKKEGKRKEKRGVHWTSCQSNQIFAKVQKVFNKCSQRKSQVKINMFGNKLCHAMNYATNKNIDS